MSLTRFKTSDLAVMLLQDKWKTSLDPLLDNPANNGLILKNQALVSGTNTINHLLGRVLQGWSIIRRRQWLNSLPSGTPTAYDIYDVQNSNQNPALTLFLTCNQGTSANPVLIDLYVF